MRSLLLWIGLSCPHIKIQTLPMPNTSRFIAVGLSLPLPPFRFLPVCSKFKADIAFLVDESSSIGQSNFLKMKEFLFRIVSYFPRIGPEGTQVINSHSTYTCGDGSVSGGFLSSPSTESTATHIPIVESRFACLLYAYMLPFFPHAQLQNVSWNDKSQASLDCLENKEKLIEISFCFL